VTTPRTRRLQPAVRPPRGRLLLASSALAAVAVLLAGGALLLVGEPSPATSPLDVQPASTTIVAQGDADASEDTATDDVPVPLPLVAYELFLERDPFEPVVPEPPAPDPTDPTGPGTPGQPTDPSSPGQPGDPQDPGSNGGCTGTTEVVCDGRVISVVEVLEENGEPVVVLEIGTMRYRAEVGDTVADVFQVVSISPDRVRLLYGDRVVTVLVADNALK
jgi:hypothetical protein